MRMQAEGDTKTCSRLRHTQRRQRLTKPGDGLGRRWPCGSMHSGNARAEWVQTLNTAISIVVINGRIEAICKPLRVCAATCARPAASAPGLAHIGAGTGARSLTCAGCAIQGLLFGGKFTDFTVRPPPTTTCYRLLLPPTAYPPTHRRGSGRCMGCFVYRIERRSHRTDVLRCPSLSSACHCHWGR